MVLLLNEDEYFSEYRAIPALLNNPKGKVLTHEGSIKNHGCAWKSMLLIPVTRESLKREGCKSEASLVNLVKIKQK